MKLAYSALDVITFTDPDSVSEYPYTLVIDKGEVFTVNPTQGWVQGRRGRLAMVDVMEDVQALFQHGKIALTSLPSALPQPKAQVVDIAARLRARPDLLFALLQELKDLKVTGPWVQRSPTQWHRLRPTGHLVVLITVTPPVTAFNGQAMVALTEESWHISFPGEPGIGVQTDLTSLAGCQSYADEQLRAVHHILL